MRKAVNQKVDGNLQFFLPTQAPTGAAGVQREHRCALEKAGHPGEGSFAAGTDITRRESDTVMAPQSALPEACSKLGNDRNKPAA